MNVNKNQLTSTNTRRQLEGTQRQVWMYLPCSLPSPRRPQTPSCMCPRENEPIDRPPSLWRALQRIGLGAWNGLGMVCIGKGAKGKCSGLGSSALT